VPPLSQHAMAQVAAVAGVHLPGGVPFGVASPDPPTPNFWKHPAVSRSPAASISSRSASTAALAEAAVAAEATAQQQGKGLLELTPQRGRKQQGEGAEGEAEEDVGSSPGGLMFLMSPVGQTPAPAHRPSAAAAAAAEEQPESKPAAAAAAEDSDAVAAGSSGSPGSSVSYGNVVMGPGGSPVIGGTGRTNSWDLHPAFGRSLSGGRAGGWVVLLTPLTLTVCCAIRMCFTKVCCYS
jgi:hypothetical protein